MNTNALRLPDRTLKPRQDGITVLIDNGAPTAWFEDVIDSHGELIDYVKFGWGTSVVTKQLGRKIDCLVRNQVEYFFGGTLFEKFYSQGKLNEYRDYCLYHGCKTVEISNGTVDMSNEEKSRFVSRFARDFAVFSEVGYKETEKSLNLPPRKWIEYIQEDLAAGATKVITEARESGKSGICRSDGELRYGLIDEILDAIDPVDVIFEAPNKELQSYFVKTVGTNVNLANIPFEHAVGLETLRLGLRSDTFKQFEELDQLARSEQRVPLSHSVQESR